MSDESTTVISEDQQVQRGAGKAGSDGSIEGFPRADIQRNMSLLLAFNVLFMAGNVLVASPINPLLVILGASNFQIGLVNGAMWASMIGQFFCPYVTRLFRVRRWYLIGQSVIMNTPQLLSGFLVMFPAVFHASPEIILLVYICVQTFNWVSTGFYFMPFQEMIMTSLPSTHIGRLNGLSNSLGTGLAIVATLGVVAYMRAHSDIYHFGLTIVVGTVFVWALVALFGFLREQPSHTVDTPTPWSRDMFRAAWQNKPFIRLLGISAFMACTVGVNAFQNCTFGGVTGFVPIYAMKMIHMTPAQATALNFIALVLGLVAAGPAGFIMDKYGVKKLVLVIALTGFLSNVCLVVLHNQWGVYIGMAFAGISAIVATTVLVSLFCILPQPEHRNGLFALQWMVTYGTQAIGWIVVGKLLDKIPYHTMFIVAAGLYLLLYPMLRWATAPMPNRGQVKDLE
ncbi:MAG: MFS transporter [Armatimonadetes bacterium]|nr:MFS transporter [Armatimonadota bacterium]